MMIIRWWWQWSGWLNNSGHDNHSKDIGNDGDYDDDETYDDDDDDDNHHNN